MNWTIKSLLEWSSGYLRDKGIVSARLDAELLLAFVLNLSRLQLYLQFERPLSGKELTDYKTLIKRRTAHEPVALITGKKEFWSRDFFINKNVLIPRPETELLVEVVLDHVRSQYSGRAVHGFEMGLGSGCISVTLLAECPLLRMTAIEISEAAISVASENAKRHGVFDRLAILHGDFFTDRDGVYDFLVSNPPYVAAQEWEHLIPDVRDHEPRLALEGGPDGLVFFRRMASFVKKNIKPQGLFAVEMGEDQASAVKSILGGVSKRDYSDRERVIYGQNCC